MGLTIVGVAGAIGSGKTRLAEEVATQAGGTHVSFGNYVRAVATARGEPTDRESLQNLGESLLADRGARDFSADVIGTLTGLVVVDGVRHTEVDSALRQLADRYLLVFVDVDETLRRRRLEERTEGARNIACIASHSTERDLPLLRELADVVTSSDRSEDVMARLRD